MAAFLQGEGEECFFTAVDLTRGGDSFAAKRHAILQEAGMGGGLGGHSPGSLPFGLQGKPNIAMNHSDNVVTVKASPMKIHAEIEPVYILGDFSVDPAAKGWYISAPKGLLTTGSWLNQGMPFYSWGVTYTGEYSIKEKSGKYKVILSDWKGTVSEVFADDKKVAVIAFPPYEADITAFINPGINKIGVRVIGSLRNLQGPFHNNPPTGLASPGNWRNVKNYPAGSEYSLYDYGLMKVFELQNGN